MALGGTLLGVVLDLIGILFSTSGNLLMRWVANRDEKRLVDNPDYKKPKEYLDPLWYLIVILLFGNGAIDFAAFQFATMTILAPLASVSIVLNSVVAYFLLGEKFTLMHGIGSCIMIGGATLTIITGPPEADHLVTVYTVWDFFIAPSYLIFLGCKAFLLILCVLYINFVPVLELEKHPTAKRAKELALRKEKEVQANSGTVTLSTNVVTIHEKNEEAHDEERLEENAVKEITPHQEEEETRSRQSSHSSPRREGDRLVRSSCQCPSTPRLDDVAIDPYSPTRTPAVSDAQAPDVNRPWWQRLLYTQGHVVVWSFLVSGIGSYTNLTGKIFVKLIAASAAGDMQFTHWGAYLIAVLLVVAAVTQLHLMKICLARFESIVIMPSLNCMYILHLMCEGGMFFNEFGHFTSDLYKGLFALSIVIAFIGITVASSVKEQSLDAKPEKATELAVLDSSKDPIPVQ